MQLAKGSIRQGRKPESQLVYPEVLLGIPVLVYVSSRLMVV